MDIDYEKYLSERETVSEGNIRSGADVARELGITRVAVKKTTQKAITKIYTAVEKTLGSESTPLQNVLYLAQMLNVENDVEGMKTIIRNLSSEQKKLLFDDVKKNYPQYASFIPGLE